MIYRFGNCLLDTEQHELRRVGEIVDVEPRVYEVLLYLIKHRRQVVTRDELLEHCWPGMYISDGTLSRCISRVRQAIGQKRSGEQLIQTLHARGYRFIGTVTEEQNPSEVTGQVLQPAPTTQDQSARQSSEPISTQPPLWAMI